MDQKARIRIVSDIQKENLYHRPLVCEKCHNNVMHFNGCGTYKCPSCGHTALDDWGKVREFLYSHKNSTALDIENALGISRREVNQMLRESKIQVANGADTLLTCTICGKRILSGKYCERCEQRIHEEMENRARAQLQHEYQGIKTAPATVSDGRMYYDKMKSVRKNG